MINLNNLIYGDNYPIVDVKITEDKIELYVESKVKKYKCPTCGAICESTHDTHTRHIQDTPIHNKETWINLTVKEFECHNKMCKAKTFTEEVPFAGKRQVMTYYLQYYIVTLAIYMSSNATSLILSLVGVRASADTVDNILKNIEIKDNKDVEKIGIDDVSLRKGISYATAIYDLENHQLIALLKGREKDDIIPWLKEHPKIKVVARDRASAYAEAINEVLPNAIQIADRFHLFQNLVVYLKNILYKEIPDKIMIKDGQITKEKVSKVIQELSDIDEKILSSMSYDNTPPTDKNNNIVNYISTQQSLTSKLSKQQEQNRLEKYQKIKELRNEYYNGNNTNLSELSNTYKLSITTIRKYLKMPNEEIENIKEKRSYNTKENEMKSYSNMIYKMLIDNVEFKYIFAYVKNQGYKGTDIHLKNFIMTLASNNNINEFNCPKRYNRYEYPKDVTVISRYEILKYLLTIDEKKFKNKIIEENIELLQNEYPIIKEIKTIFLDFHDTIFSNDTEMLDIFIETYKDKIKSFCNGLKKDITAVKHAISHTINSGFVEGNNNKFKLIKRIVYGKQKLCNLFKRSWLNFSSTLDDLSILKLTIDPFIKYKKQGI